MAGRSSAVTPGKMAIRRQTRISKRQDIDRISKLIPFATLP